MLGFIMDLQDIIINDLETNNLQPVGLNIVYYNSKAFGDYKVTVDTKIGKLVILRERGQIYLDILVGDDEIIPIENKYPKVKEVYNKSTWTLNDILNSIAM